MVVLVNMSQSHIQRYSEFLSRPTSSPLPEKNLSASDIDALIAKGEEVVKSIMRDNKKTSEEKKTAQSVLKWIQSVKVSGVTLCLVGKYLPILQIKKN